MKIKFIRISHIVFMFIFNITFSTMLFAEEFVGFWVLADSKGNPFEIQIRNDGSASGTHGKDMKHGSWQEKDGKIIISWGTGWVTVIAKDGESYIKKAFKPGVSLNGIPTNISSAKRKYN